MFKHHIQSSLNSQIRWFLVESLEELRRPIHFITKLSWVFSYRPEPEFLCLSSPLLHTELGSQSLGLAQTSLSFRCYKLTSCSLHLHPNSISSFISTLNLRQPLLWCLTNYHSLAALVLLEATHQKHPFVKDYLVLFQSCLVTSLLGGEHARDLSKFNWWHGVLSRHCADWHLS